MTRSLTADRPLYFTLFDGQKQALESETLARFELRTGEMLAGQVRWWDLGAFGLELESGGPLIVVQRHAVLDWEGAGA